MRDFCAHMIIVAAAAFWLGGAAGSTLPQRSVLVFRHCVRSTPNTTYYISPSDVNVSKIPLNDFSSPEHPFPAWPVDTYMCMPEGLDLVESAGRQLFASLPQPLLQENILVDTNATRDIDTAQALLRGFGLDEALYTPDPCLFKPEDCGMCAAYPDDALQAAVAARFGQVPRPANLKRKLEALQDFVLG